MAKRLILCLLVFLLLPTFLFSGTTGKIAGFVKDKETGDPLVGVNILIDGTSLGAATDLVGEYYIINIPPGVYSVRSSMIGYKGVKVTQIRVSPDLTTRVEFNLEQEIISGEAVTVVAERPLIQKDVTYSGTTTSAEEIENMPVNTFQEVMGISAGINVYGRGSLNANDPQGIHIRGGRANEVVYMIDGFYVKDPHSGGVAADVGTQGVQDLSIITGTFNAEYGEAMSGVVNIVTKEGTPAYHGLLNFSTDQFGVEDYDNNTNRSEVTLSGPVPLLGEKANFFFSAYNLNTDTYLRQTQSPAIDPATGKGRIHNHLTFDEQERYTGKVVFRPFNNFKTVFGYNHYFRKQRLYDVSFKEIPDHLGLDYNRSDLYHFTLTHQLNPETFYNLKVSWFEYNFKHALTEDFDSIVKPKLDNDSFDGTSNYEFYGDYVDHTEFDTTYAPTNPDSIVGIDTTDVIVMSDDDFYNKYETREFSIMGDITSQVHKNHLAKFGFEYKSYRIKQDQIGQINYNGLGKHENETHFHYFPLKFSAFLQDKMEFRQFVINAGLRFDYLDPKAKYFPDFYNTDVSTIKDTDAKWKISPRIGFGHPLTDKIRLHFAYGHFYQFPEFNKLYRRWNNKGFDTTDGYRPSMGNPNLKPQTTIAYEVGTELALSNELVADVTVFYKDIYDYISTKFYDINPAPYFAIVNLDYANTKGIELSLRKRFSNHYSAAVNYTFSRAEGNADEWDTMNDLLQNASVTGQIPPKNTVTLEWDQPHNFSFQFDVRWIDNWGLNVIGSFASGLPYTPTDARGRNIGALNSARMPWTGTVDLRINKDFKFFGIRERLFANIWNVFDRKNVLNVFTNSGKPDYSANPNASAELMHRPEWYGPPRTIELGLELSF